MNIFCGEIAREKDMKGLHVLVTAGPTQSPLILYAILRIILPERWGMRLQRYVCSVERMLHLSQDRASIEKPHFVNVVPITTAREMFEEVTGQAEEQDIIIKAAAVADYRPRYVSDEKVKKKG